jgi:hypothetical protein
MQLFLTEKDVGFCAEGADAWTAIPLALQLQKVVLG